MHFSKNYSSNNWEDVSSFFQFSDDIRRIMYTANIIEGVNRQYRNSSVKYGLKIFFIDIHYCSIQESIITAQIELNDFSNNSFNASAVFLNVIKVPSIT